MRGRRITAPSRSVMRPTQERVREALFSMLADRIRGCRFLDLFAGSGIVALEAWSRGAVSVTVVEKDRRGCLALQRTVERLQLSQSGMGALHIVCSDVARFLERRRGVGSGDAVDIVFADPPYQADGGAEWVSRLGRLLVAAGLPGRDGLWIMETSLRQKASLPEAWETIEDRKYGETRLTFYRRARSGSSGTALLRTACQERSA